MWINAAGQLYEGDCRIGDRAATDEEVAIIRTPTPQQQRDVIQAQIDALERKELMPRAARLALMKNTIGLAAVQGVTEPQLYATDIEYRKIKDFESQIAVLRAQMAAISY